MRPLDENTHTCRGTRSERYSNQWVTGGWSRRGGDWSCHVIRHIHQLRWAENWNGNVGLERVGLPSTPGPKLMICHFSQGHKLLPSRSHSHCRNGQLHCPLLCVLYVCFMHVLCLYVAPVGVCYCSSLLVLFQFSIFLLKFLFCCGLFFLSKRLLQI